MLQNSQENYLCQSLFFNKAGLRPATLLKKRPWHRYFPVNFAKVLRTPFFLEHLRWLLLCNSTEYEWTNMVFTIGSRIVVYAEQFPVRVTISSYLYMRPATLLKKRLWRRCFPVNFVKFLRTPFLQNTSGRLLLYKISSYFLK